MHRDWEEAAQTEYATPMLRGLFDHFDGHAIRDGKEDDIHESAATHHCRNRRQSGHRL
jgi:hypothetical protein